MLQQMSGHSSACSTDLQHQPTLSSLNSITTDVASQPNTSCPVCRGQATTNGRDGEDIPVRCSHCNQHPLIKMKPSKPVEPSLQRTLDVICADSMHRRRTESGIKRKEA